MTTSYSPRSAGTGVDRPSSGVRAGLAFSVLLGLANLPFLVPDAFGGSGDAPPYWVLVVNAAIGVVSIVAAVVAWPDGHRTAIRIDAAALIVNALLTVPGLFVNDSAGIKLATAAFVLLTVVSVVLMLRRERAPLEISD